jgi:hypothetical protein
VNSGNYIEESPISFAWACFVMCIGGLFFEVFVLLEGFKIMDGTSYGTTIKESSKFSFETIYLLSGFSELKKGFIPLFFPRITIWLRKNTTRCD